MINNNLVVSTRTPLNSFLAPSPYLESLFLIYEGCVLVHVGFLRRLPSVFARRGGENV
jgi:hypothetical protein